MLSRRCQEQLLHKMENLFISRCGAFYLPNTRFLIVYIHLKNLGSTSPHPLKQSPVS